MTTRIALFSLCLLLACDTEESTSPLGPSASTLRQVDPAEAHGKVPPPPAGFTKVTLYYSEYKVIAAGTFSDLYAACPAGSVATGGGYSSSVSGTPPYITFAGLGTPGADPTPTTYWVGVRNLAAGASSVGIKVHVA